MRTTTAFGFRMNFGNLASTSRVFSSRVVDRIYFLTLYKQDRYPQPTERHYDNYNITMTETFKKQLSAAKKEVEETKVATADLRQNLNEQINTLVNYTSRYEDSWGGDWAENTNIYSQNFDLSNGHWMTINYEYLKGDILKNVGISIDEMQNQIPKISKRFFELKDFLVTELSFIRDINAFTNETELLRQIEDFKWGMTPRDYTRSRRPKYAVVYDASVVNRGIPTPPHIEIGEHLIFVFSILTSYDNFEKLAYRLIRQLELKSATNSDTEVGAIFQQQALKAIIDKFHLVATQLKNRYNNRPTVTVDDEYDVQDLMNSLLRINFEDVRKEEYTPSYAGGSTRIDFLLKREKILIEVKKTRTTLKDKDVGNQLIIDIAHYRSHPDCKHLICFVYDPDNLIVNPRGLEDDLNKNSLEEMIVEVYVRP